MTNAIITLFGFQWGGLFFQTMHRQREIGFSLAVAIAAICFLLAFRLTCIALRRSSHVYRLQANIGT
jgi:hypothetical protein